MEGSVDGGGGGLWPYHWQAKFQEWPLEKQLSHDVRDVQHSSVFEIILLSVGHSHVLVGK